MVKNMSKEQTPNTGFQALLNSMMKRRWFITALVLGTFILIVAGIFVAIEIGSAMAGEWKELLLLMLGAFIGSYGKIIDYWFSDTDKDKMLVQKMDEEDGVSLSNTADIKDTPREHTSLVDPTFAAFAAKATEEKPKEKKGVEIDEDGDGVMDGIDLDGDGDIDEYFAHRQCEHVWGDADGDGDEECLKCGKIKDI
jgi:hypothetical protein